MCQALNNWTSIFKTHETLVNIFTVLIFHYVILIILDTLAMISGLSQLGQGTAGMRSWTRQQAAPRFGTSSVEGGTTDSDVTISAVVSDIRTRTGSDQGSGNLRKWTKSLAPAQQIPTPSNLSEEYNFSHFLLFN